jgi:hypothetical protein
LQYGLGGLVLLAMLPKLVQAFGRLLNDATESALRARAAVLRRLSSTRDLSHYEIRLPAKPNWSQRKSTGGSLHRFGAGFSRGKSSYARVSVGLGGGDEGDSVDEGQPLTQSRPGESTR